MEPGRGTGGRSLATEAWQPTPWAETLICVEEEDSGMSSCLGLQWAGMLVNTQTYFLPVVLSPSAFIENCKLIEVFVSLVLPTLHSRTTSPPPRLTPRLRVDSPSPASPVSYVDVGTQHHHICCVALYRLQFEGHCWKIYILCKYIFPFCLIKPHMEVSVFTEILLRHYILYTQVGRQMKTHRQLDKHTDRETREIDLDFTNEALQHS